MRRKNFRRESSLTIILNWQPQVNFGQFQTLNLINFIKWQSDNTICRNKRIANSPSSTSSEILNFHMERIESEAPQCGLCSKASAQAVRIAKCSHVYCTLCLFDYLAKRRYCPICVPKKAKSRSLGKYILTYLHPLKLIKKIKKHNKKIARKHLIPVTATNRNHCNNQAGERDFWIFGFFVGS